MTEDHGKDAERSLAFTASPFGGTGGGLAASLSCPSTGHMADVLPQVMAAARQCTLLTAALQPVATASTLEAAAAAAVEALPPGTAAAHTLRLLVTASGAARSPAERHLRYRLQQLGLGTRPDRQRAPLWCIQHQSSAAGAPPTVQQQSASSQPAAPGTEEYLIGLQLATGTPPSAAAAAAIKRLGPTAMQAELAALSASLATVPPGAAVLDPFCGTGSLLAAALLRGAALAVGSDIDDTHFGGAAGSGTGGGGTQGSSSTGGSRGSCAYMHADAASLQELLPAQAVDAILTDLPYGYRTTISSAATDSSRCGASSGEDAFTSGVTPVPAAAAEQDAGGSAEDWRRLLGVLLQLAQHVLVPGGRLLAWMPCLGDEEQQRQQQQELAAAGAEHGLRLLHFLPESRQRGYPRAVALYQRDTLGSSGSDSGSSSGGGSVANPGCRRDSLLAALQGAEARGIPVHWHARQAGAGLTVSGPGAAHAATSPSAPTQEVVAGGGAAGSTAAASDAAPAPASAAAAVQLRGQKYKQVRGQLSGTAIDVWRAAWLGDVAAVREYAAAGGDVNARDRKRQTPLQFAAGYGREAVVQLLLDVGADPSAADDASGMAALHRAAARNHTPVVRRLLAAGADPGQRSAAGQTPLMYASQFGHEAAVAALLEHLKGGTGDKQAAGQGAGRHCAESAGQAPGASSAAAVPFKPAHGQRHDGSEGGQQGAQQAQHCIGGSELGALRHHLALCDSAGLSALHLAAQWGMAGVAELLLQAGADPDQSSQDERQLAPAHLAARWGHPAVLCTLQRHGADLEARCGGKQWTPLQEAQEWRRAECEALLQA